MMPRMLHPRNVRLDLHTQPDPVAEMLELVQMQVLQLQRLALNSVWMNR